MSFNFTGSVALYSAGVINFLKSRRAFLTITRLRSAKAVTRTSDGQFERKRGLMESTKSADFARATFRGRVIRTVAAMDFSEFRREVAGVIG